MHYTKSFLVGVALVCGLAACSGGTEDAIPAPATNPTASQPGNGNTTNEGTNTPKTPETPQPDPKKEDPKPTCNEIANDATPITYVDALAEDAPPPTGGAMTNGTYHLKSISLYVGPKGKAAKIPLNLKHTVRVTGNVVDMVMDGTKNDGQVIAEKSTETFSVTGSTVTYTGVCPNTKSRTGTYSVTGGVMTLFLKNDIGQTAAYVYAP